MTDYAEAGGVGVSGSADGLRLEIDGVGRVQALVVEADCQVSAGSDTWRFQTQVDTGGSGDPEEPEFGACPFSKILRPHESVKRAFVMLDPNMGPGESRTAEIQLVISVFQDRDPPPGYSALDG